MERTDGLAWLATDAGASVPWVSLLMLAGGLGLLAIVAMQWRRKGAGDRTPTPSGAAAARAEVESLVRELIADLDARADRLERLIAEADRRMERADRPQAEQKPARAPGGGSRDGADPMAHRIYGLADEGLPVVEIARRLEQPTGKVELILALRGR